MAKKLKWESVGSDFTRAEVPVLTGPLTEEDRAEINERIGPDDFTVLPEQAALRTLADAGISGTLEEIAKHPAVSKGELVSPEWFAYSILETINAIREVLGAGNSSPVKYDPAGNAALLSFFLGAIVVSGGLKFGHEMDAILGMKDRIPRRKGGETRGLQITEDAEKRNAEVLAMNAELLPRHPSERERAAIIARKTKKSVATIRAILRSK